MTFRYLLALVIAACLLLLTGCETATQKPATASAPVKQLPTPAPAPATAAVLEKPKPAEPPPPPAQAADAVAPVLSDSDVAYKAGVEAYRTGHLERAKREFDSAVDILLRSPKELRADGRIDRQFEKLIDEIYHYEVLALKEGDGFSEQHPVPAPVDEIAELTFPTDAKLKEKVEREVKDTVSDIPLVTNDYVLGYVNYFTSRGRTSMETAMRRAGRYRPMISRILAEEGVPQDLIYLAQAESAFQPWALSRAGARGIWQFMASSGRLYDLNVNWWVDDRQDPERATRAAARYLKDLYETFGDWYLAMAAYNSGPGGVSRAIERTGYADFWELYRRGVLPRETRNYVPIILAMTIVAKNPEKYGFYQVLSDPAVETDDVVVSTPTDLRLIAETIDVSVDLLQTLNPSLLRMATPNGDFHLKLPAGTRDRFLQQIAMIPEDKRVLWRWHKVEPDEGLNQIAAKYHTTAEAIREVNSLASDDVQTGAKLVIPVTTSRDAGGGTRVVRLRYRVKRGDTVARVADRFGVSPSEIRAWNRVRGNNLPAGRVLVIRTSYSGPGASAAERSIGSRRRKGTAVAKSKRSRKVMAGTEKTTGQIAKAGSDAATP